MRQLVARASACIGVENQLHWTLLVTSFAEDASGSVLVMHRKISHLRRIALNSLNRELSFKRSTAEI